MSEHNLSFSDDKLLRNIVKVLIRGLMMGLKYITKFSIKKKICKGESYRLPGGVSFWVVLVYDFFFFFCKGIYNKIWDYGNKYGKIILK